MMCSMQLPANLCEAFVPLEELIRDKELPRGNEEVYRVDLTITACGEHSISMRIRGARCAPPPRPQHRELALVKGPDWYFCGGGPEPVLPGWELPAI